MSSAVRNGGAQRLKDGVWAIRVPIPDNPLGYTLVYALAAASGVVLVDGGWDCDEAWRGLRAGLRECGFDAADVRAVLVTHGHPDHIGLTRRIKAASGCQIVMHRGEVPDPAASGGPALEDRVHFLSSCGVPEPEAREFAEALTADPTVPTAWSPDRVV
jgi:glyoxylase-like metal-dependent hydrolase (beta-lactamase superfamily II)